jgi:hypothetical protein
LVLCSRLYSDTPVPLSVADQLSLTGTVLVPSVVPTLKLCAGGCTIGAVASSTVQVWLAGVVSALPSASVALTPKVWDPSERSV